MAEVTLHPLPPLVRISLRCGPEARVPLGAAFGVALPEVPLCAEAAGARAALWLGPDEWLLLAGDAVDLAALEAARGAAPASIVEVSAGRAGFALEGAAAPLLLAEGVRSTSMTRRSRPVPAPVRCSARWRWCCGGAARRAGTSRRRGPWRRIWARIWPRRSPTSMAEPGGGESVMRQ
ncbi:sarcosine oxidase subunit gamma family protein [Siccirubricoccus deserti]